MTPRRIIIDTDPGVDDAMAIHLAFAHPGLEVVGLTTGFGNVTTEVATRNALVLAEMAGRAVPVAAGASVPLVQPQMPPADHVHGREGFGDLPARRPRGRPDPRPAWRFLVETVAAAPGEITICAIGRLTNLALALRADPAFARNVRDVVLMGGVVEEDGNVTEFAEANIYGDPHAADAVFAAPWQVTMVGLDVTHAVVCTPEDFAWLAGRAPRIGGFLDEAAQFYIRFYKTRRGVLGCCLHDPAAVIAITNPELFGVRSSPITVVVEGEEAGRTVADPAADRPAVNWCMEVDSEAVRRVFLDTVAEADARIPPGA